MSAPLTVQQATRRFVLLTALRWAPVGITVPVTVLLALSRGLTLAEVGLVFIAHSALIVVLELPTGGLADALGRRPVLVASGLLHLAALVAMATADGVPGFLLGACLQGVGRALDSGPLQAWYVDAVRLADPRADVVPGLSRAGTADCAALALGAVAGGLAPSLLGGAPSTVLLLPFAVAAVLDLVSVVSVALLVTPTGPAREGSVGQVLRAGLAAVPSTVGGAVRLSARDGALRRVLLLAGVCGFSLSTLELFGPPLFAGLAGSTTGGSGLFGVVMGVSFLAGAAGLAARAARPAPGRRLDARRRRRPRRRVRPRDRRRGRGDDGRAGGGAAYAAFYLGNAATFPLLYGVLHARVGAEGRATVLSAESLCLQLGGAVSGLLMPALASATGGPGAVFVVCRRRRRAVGPAGRRAAVRRRGSPARRAARRRGAPARRPRRRSARRCWRAPPAGRRAGAARRSRRAGWRRTRRPRLTSAAPPPAGAPGRPRTSPRRCGPRTECSRTSSRSRSRASRRSDSSRSSAPKCARTCSPHVGATGWSTSSSTTRSRPGAMLMIPNATASTRCSANASSQASYSASKRGPSSVSRSHAVT